ncbi:hypothetical protein [Bosea sp. (in: a-proteobacteria)]|uniref:hypothetical protein n=1 Tax=Bosea sp. (in: a-proteobacteria) TaxID=1871050 RepID=UPI0025BD0453|nr:hypothetical protein [Bosea sp. (in: a-proteobacteria)]MBR3193500.1 hypothetical protein [Bosea sp. (in: a-proteobacteria)]
MNLWLALAAVLAAITTLIHVILGGRYVTTPLLATERLHAVPKFTMYYCWHLVTIVLAALALAFGLVATGRGSRDLALFATAGAALFCLWSLGMIGLFRLRIAHFPQWLLFATITVSGMIGLWQ